jgi:hypothetical protein
VVRSPDADGAFHYRGILGIQEKKDVLNQLLQIS